MKHKTTIQGQEDFIYALELHRKGRLDKAEKCYRKILKRSPNHTEALHFFGVLLHQSGKSNEGLKLIRRALELKPDYIDAHNNLGNVLKELKLFEQAEMTYRIVISLNPDFPDAHNNLGVALKSQRRFHEAIKCYQQAIELNPYFADAWNNLGNAYSKADMNDEAISAYRQAILLSPQSGYSYEHLGRILYVVGRTQEAIDVYHEWHKQDPNNPIAEHMIAACTGLLTPKRASDAYVQKVFDGYADEFDESLKQLEYRAPQFVSDAAKKWLGTEQPVFSILDAGCGTGLCAQHFKPFAARLVGVDLSPGMIAKAKKLNLYDDLIVTELTEYLSRRNNEYNLIVSADTLCYFGALEDVINAAYRSLSDNGYLIFTLENALENAIEGYKINPHGRYSHNEPYVRSVLENAGFSIVEISHETLRKESGKLVAGLVVVAQSRLKSESGSGPS